jgi:hypothetical protein
MSKFKPRFSLRTLFIVTTVVAIVTAFVATHVRIVLGFFVAVLWLFEFAGGPIIDFVEAWPELKKPKPAKPPHQDEVAAADKQIS